MHSTHRFARWFSAFVLLVASAAGLAQPSLGALPRKPVFGAQVAPLTAEERTAAQLKEEPALRIVRVLPNLTANDLGLQAGDVLLSLDSVAIASASQLIAHVATRKAGEATTARIVRGTSQSTKTGTWTERAREGSNATYRVEYAHVTTPRGRMRTIVTTPAAASGGKHPALLFIQGVTLGSVDFPLSDENSYAQIVRSFAQRGYVTMRVDKPGVGDSEGGPGAKVDFNEELEAYRQGLKTLLARGDVDPHRVVLFGHSMGGLWGPVLAGEFKLAATIVSGTTFRTWMEYEYENTRRQSALGGSTAVEIDRELKVRSAIMHHYYNEKLDPAAIAQKFPTLADAIKEDFPDLETRASRSHQFWRQVNELNLPAAWQKASGHVLALWGEAEFIAGELDHQLLEAWVNSQRAGSAKYIRVPQSDHAFSLAKTPAESLANWGKPAAKFNPNVIDIVHEWLGTVPALTKTP